MKSKITFLAAAALAVVGATTTVSNSSKIVKADSINDTSSQKADAQRVTDHDVVDAKSDVISAEQGVTDAQNSVASAKQDIENAQNDYDNTVKNTSAKPDDSKLVAAKRNVIDAQNDVTSAQKGVIEAQNNVNTKQNSVNSTKQAADSARQNADNEAKNLASMKAQQVSDKSAASKAQAAVKADENEPVNDLRISDSYKTAVKKYDGQIRDNARQMRADRAAGRAVNDRSNEIGMAAADFTSTMKRASAESFGISQYKASQKDKQTQVNLDNMTQNQQKELTEFAAGIINSVREQCGLKPVVVNSDAISMATEVAQGYEADGRSIEDGRHHDNRAVNQAAKHFGFDYDKSETGQYFEDMGGFQSTSVFYPVMKSYATRGWYNSTNEITHTASMSTLKEGLYLNLKEMFFNDSEWFHAYSLLGAADYNQNISSPNSITKFGLSLSILPNSNYISSHMLFMPTNMSDGMHMTAATDIAMTSVADKLATQTAHKIDAERLSKALADQGKAIAAQAAKTAAAQTTAERLSKAYQTADAELLNAVDALMAAKTKLGQKQAALQAAEDFELATEQANADFVKANQAYQARLAVKKQAVENAKTRLTDATEKFTAAKAALAKAKDKFNRVSAAKTAQDLADKAQAEVAKKPEEEVQKAEDNQTKPAKPSKPETVVNPTAPVEATKSVVTDRTTEIVESGIIPKEDSTPLMLHVFRSKNSYIVTFNGKTFNFTSFYDLLLFLKKQSSRTRITINKRGKLKTFAAITNIDGENVRSTTSVMIPDVEHQIDSLITINGTVFAHIADADADTWVAAELIA